MNTASPSPTATPSIKGLLFKKLRIPVVILILWWAASFIALNFLVDFIILEDIKPAEITKLIKIITNIGFIILSAIVLMKCFGTAESIINIVFPGYDTTTVDLITKLLKIVVLFIGAMIVLSIMDVNIAGLVAFGGMSSFIIGFAAKDIISNFFGGLMIYIDKPFKKGDWIRSPNQDIEGIVEHIGWRITRIRTFSQTPLYLQNSVFNTITIENSSRIHKWRIKELVGVRYQDADKIEQITNRIIAMLKKHSKISKDNTLLVGLENFNSSSLDILVYCFTKTKNWQTYQLIKQGVMLEVYKIIKEEGADIAFPTRSLYFEDNNEPVLPPKI